MSYHDSLSDSSSEDQVVVLAATWSHSSSDSSSEEKVVVLAATWSDSSSEDKVGVLAATWSCLTIWQFTCVGDSTIVDHPFCTDIGKYH